MTMNWQGKHNTVRSSSQDYYIVVSLAKMVTLTNNIVYKKSAQYRKYIWTLPRILIFVHTQKRFEIE